MGLLTSPHQTLSRLAGSSPTKLSFGERPVWVPVGTTDGPPAATTPPSRWSGGPRVPGALARGESASAVAAIVRLVVQPGHRPKVMDWRGPRRAVGRDVSRTGTGQQNARSSPAGSGLGAGMPVVRAR